MNTVCDRARSRFPLFSGVRTGLPGRRLGDCEVVVRAPRRLLLQSILLGGLLALRRGRCAQGRFARGAHNTLPCRSR